MISVAGLQELYLSSLRAGCSLPGGSSSALGRSGPIARACARPALVSLTGNGPVGGPWRQGLIASIIAAPRPLSGTIYAHREYLIISPYPKNLHPEVGKPDACRRVR